MGPDALRGPAGPLPIDPAEDANLPPELLALKQAAERRLAEWQASGRGLGASSLVDAAVFCSSGLGDAGRHDIEIIFFLTGGNEEFLRTILNIDTSRFFDDAGKCVASRHREHLTLLPNPVLPRSRGRNRPRQRRSRRSRPAIRYNYYDDPHDHEGHGGGDPPGDGHRRALAGQPQAGAGHDPALPGRETRLPRRRRAERRAARRFRAALLADRVPPDLGPAGSAMSSIRACG